MNEKEQKDDCNIESEKALKRKRDLEVKDRELNHVSTPPCEPPTRRQRSCSVHQDEDSDVSDEDAPAHEFHTEKVNVTLECKELWMKFHELGTEMIITKAGRRMFPVVRVRISGVNPQKQYLVAMDIDPVDDMRYRYAYHRSNWLVAGKADPQPGKRFYLHPDCPFSGEQLLSQAISFEKVKLTNNEMDHNSHVILNSMHKYQPRVHVITKPEKWDGSCDKLIGIPKYTRSFSFPETSFIAVTAYQNQLITKLKINSNPFAKGFRDSSRFVSVDRPQKGTSYTNCRCNTGSPYCCHNNRSYNNIEEKESFSSYPSVASQSGLDIVYKTSQISSIPSEDMPISPYQTYLPTAMPQGIFDYAYHKALPHPNSDWYQYSQPPPSSIPVPSSMDGYSSSTAMSPYLSAVSSIWNGSTVPSAAHHSSRYHIK